MSVGNALANLRAEIPGWSFDTVRSAATNAWNAALNRIQVSGGTAAEREIFYTALYHSLLLPSVFSDANGQYVGMDGAVHADGGHPQYTNVSGWDVYRSQTPLLAMLFPRRTSDIVRSLLGDATQSGGWLPKWAIAGSTTNTMNGDSADAIIAGAYAFGARDFDAGAALSQMIRGATVPGTGPDGYLERPGLAQYLDHGYVAYSFGAQPGELGGDHARVRDRRLHHRTAGRGAGSMVGLVDVHAPRAELAAPVQSRDRVRAVAHGRRVVRRALRPGERAGVPRRGRVAVRLDGAPEPGGPGQRHGGRLGGRRAAADVLHDAARRAVVALVPGVERARPGGAVGVRLHGTAVAHTGGGAADRDEALHRRPRAGSRATTTWGRCRRGTCGRRSGSTKEIPGVAGLAVASPLFTDVAVDVPGDAWATIVAPGAADDAPYVTSLTVDGEDRSSPWLPLADLTEGRTIAFGLSTEPDTSWGTDAAPPSFTGGQAPGHRVHGTERRRHGAPRQTRSLVIGVQSVVDTALDVTWSVTAPAGVHVVPDTGTLSLAAGGEQQTTLQVQASGSAHAGTIVLRARGTVPGGRPVIIPRIVVRVAVS